MDAARLLPGEAPIKHLLSTLEMAAASERFMDKGLDSLEPVDEGGSLKVSLSGLKSYLSSLGKLQPSAKESLGEV